jgi:hypothetical protein
MTRVTLRRISMFAALALIVAPPAFATSTSTGLDTPNTSADQYFAIGGTQVGDWKLVGGIGSLALTGSLSTTTGLTTGGDVTSTGGNIISNAGTVKGVTVTATTGGVTVIPSGTTSVAYLNGSGVGYVSSSFTSGNTVTANGAMWSPAYYHSSDARLKTDIHPIDNSLDKLLKLRGVEFNWKKDGRPDMGVVAQDVAKVFPNVVTKDEKGMMSVEYDSLVGPMIEAMRELKKENEDLKKQLTAVDDMKAQMERISGMVLDMKRQNAQMHSARLEGGEGHGVARPSQDIATP